MAESTARYHDYSSDLIASRKKKGLQYDIDIDRAILYELHLCESLSSGQLKSRIEKSLGRPIAPKVYYDHLNRMVNGEKDLEKRIQEREENKVYFTR